MTEAAAPARRQLAGAAQSARRSRRVGLRVAIVVALAILTLGAVNAIMVGDETKPAGADIGSILHLPGAQLQVRTDGPAAGPPIVLIHRFASSMREWDRIMPILDRDHRVIRIDILGHGGSAKPTGGYSIDNQARLVFEALHQLNVTHALVVGHSLGGDVAVALAALHPSTVGQVVLMDSNDRWQFFHLPALSTWAPRFLVGPALWSLSSDSMVRSGLKVLFAPGYPVPAEALRDLRRMTYTSYVETLRQFKHYLDERGLDQRLAELRIPRLVIWGGRDELVSPGALQLYRRVPGVQIVVMPRNGHSPLIEEPQQTAAAILRFSADSGPRVSTSHARGHSSR
jgi:pimeloyl-ACP methyl ester carboxylesterase